MILRFRSGSVTSPSASKYRSSANTVVKFKPCAANISWISLVSFFLIKPVSTYTQCKRSPIAWFAITAATVESTPPLQAMIAISSISSFIF